MNRRDFLGLAGGAALAHELPFSFGQSSAPAPALKPMELGLLIVPFGAPEEKIKLVRGSGVLELLSFSGWLYLAASRRRWWRSFAICWRSTVTATTVEVVGPGRWKWNFLRGRRRLGWCRRRRARRASMPCGRFRILRRSLVWGRCRRIADLFRKIRRDPLYRGGG